MSAWLGGLGVGLYLGIVGTAYIMSRLERRRIRQRAVCSLARLAEFGRIFAPQLAPRLIDPTEYGVRTPEQDAVEQLLASL